MTEPSIDIGPVLDRINAYARQLLEEDGTPGYALAITDREQTLAFRGYGYLDLPKTSVPTEETLYESGSIGKSFTAIVILQLAAEGTVDLHGSIADQLPLWEIPSDFEPITVHHLLTHTSGLIGGTDHVPAPEYELWQMRNSKIGIAPNQKFIYSNLGYKALGLLIEHVTGQPYAEVVRQRIFEPLSMRQSFGAITNETRWQIAPGYAPRYDDRPRLPRHGWVPATWLETNTADGCLTMSAPDLAAYLRMLLNHGRADDGARILTDDQFEQFTRPHAGDTPQPNYGYGIMRTTTDTTDSIAHSGGMVGYVSQMTGALTSGFGVVAFNNAYGSPDKLVTYALACLAAQAEHLDLPEIPPTLDRTNVEAADDYAGIWIGTTSITIVARNNTIAIDFEGTNVPLLAMSEEGESFVADHPALDLIPFTFRRDEFGAVVELTHGTESYGRSANGVAKDNNAVEQWQGLVGHYRAYNPWFSNVRIYQRKQTLYFAFGHGTEVPLTAKGDAFMLSNPHGDDHLITFGPFHNGSALALRFGHGAEFVRVFTP